VETELRSIRARWSRFRDDLRSFPGRAVAATRITVAVVLTCLLILFFDLPGMDIAAYVPLFGFRRRAAESVRLGAAVAILSFVAVGVTLPLWEFTVERWAWRFIALAGLGFLALLSLTVPRVGIAGYAVGTLSVMFLTFTDLVPDGGIVTTEMIRAAISVAIGGVVLAVVSSVPLSAAPAVGPESSEAREGVSLVESADFATRGTVALMLGFILYTVTDWFGIHTCMYTTLFIASMDPEQLERKGWLRIGGATAGSLLALAIMVWIIPWVQGVPGLVLIVAGVTWPAAWIAVGSDRVSYAGLQIGLACYLGLLFTDGPWVELSETRDRIVGVVLGTVLAWMAYASRRRQPSNGRLPVPGPPLAADVDN